ncbi:DUF3077 domain-containing protein [Pseudomonas sp. 2835]|uniref:DUF3077 domain-containing protein n=1 Tax=Pseudomonas sp. 2835 TaxID=3156451 RepID=UPI003D2490A3
MIKIVPDPPPAGAPAKTTCTLFGSCDGSHDPLFAVRAGVDIEDALVHISVLQRCAFVTNAQALEKADADLRELLWATQHSLEMAKALTEAVLDGLEDHSMAQRKGSS